MSKPAEICRLFESLKHQRVNFDNTYQEIIDNIDPHHADITIQRMPGEKKNGRQFDGTALYSNQVFTDFYQGAVFNPGTKWVSIRHRDKAINEKPDNVAWFDKTRDTMLEHMRNFYAPGGQAIDAWSLFGNGPVLIEEVAARKEYQSRLRYTSIPWGQYVMAEGEDGKIDQFIRELVLPAHQLLKMFGDKCSDDVKKAAGRIGDSTKEFAILHSILPRDFATYSKSSIKTNKEYDWASCWIEKDKKNELRESGYRKFPVAVARYKQISGEVYARGLGEVALANAKTMNKMVEMSLLKAGRELDPPTLTRRASIINGILDKSARGNTIVNGDPRNAVVPLFDRSDWQAFDHMIDFMGAAIQKVFHVDEILNLLSHESPQLTAFEVNARLTLLQQILGPVFGQNDVDFFSVAIDVTLDNLAHMGLLDDPPDDIAQSTTQGAFNYIYEGPLARAQRNQELVNIQQLIADVSGIAQFDPEITLLYNWEEIARQGADIRGLTQFVLSSEDYKKTVDESRQKANADKAASLIGGGAEALGKVAPFITATRQSVGGQAAA